MILHGHNDIADFISELEVKKNELDKYGTQSSPDTEKPSLTGYFASLLLHLQ